MVNEFVCSAMFTIVNGDCGNSYFKKMVPKRLIIACDEGWQAKN